MRPLGDEDQFGANVRDAIGAVLATSPAIVTGNTILEEDEEVWAALVASELQSGGLCATGRADDPGPEADRPSRDEVAVWRPDRREHFDICIASGAPAGRCFVGPAIRQLNAVGSPEGGVVDVPPPSGELCWAPTERSWSIAKGNPTDCAACSYQEMQRTGWPLGPYANSNCQRWNQWMPCRCSDGGQWPGVSYTWTQIHVGADGPYFEWRWSKGNGACDAAPGKCFCGPDQPSRWWRGEIRRSDTCLWIPDRGEGWDRNICRFEQVPCS